MLHILLRQEVNIHFVIKLITLHLNGIFPFNSKNKKESLSSATPCLSNLTSSKKLNLTKISSRNDLKQSCFKTPNKTPLHLKHVTSGKKNTPRGGLLNDR